MSFYINTNQIGDVAVLQCAGRMVRAQGLSLLRDAVISLSQLRVIVLDLSEVEMLDAGGMGLLISLHNCACENGIQLKFGKSFQAGARDARANRPGVGVAHLVGRRPHRNVLQLGSGDRECASCCSTSH